MKAIFTIAALALLLGGCADADRRETSSLETPSGADKPGADAAKARDPVLIESLDRQAPASGDPTSRADRVRTPGDQPARIELDDAEAEDERFLSVLGSRQTTARRKQRQAKIRQVNPSLAKTRPAKTRRATMKPSARPTPTPSARPARKHATAPERGPTGVRSKVEPNALNAVAPGAGPVAPVRMPDAFSEDRGLITTLKRRKAAPASDKDRAKRSQATSPKATTPFAGTLDEGNAADFDVLKALGSK